MDPPDRRATALPGHCSAIETGRWNQLLTPLRTDVLDELLWYFERVRSHPTPSRSDDLDERFYRARDGFSAPRFKALYRVDEPPPLLHPSMADLYRVTVQSLASALQREDTRLEAFRSS
jgi:hypothetical protein